MENSAPGSANGEEAIALLTEASDKKCRLGRWAKGELQLGRLPLGRSHLARRTTMSASNPNKPTCTPRRRVRISSWAMSA